MAEEQQTQEKTEEPTARRKEKAREEGQLARSRELNSMALMITGGLGLLLVAPWGAGRMKSLTEKIFTAAGCCSSEHCSHSFCSGSSEEAAGCFLIPHCFQS